jgi:hypothetical protein
MEQNTQLAAPEIMTLGDAARYFRCDIWQIRRLFERGLLPPAARIGVYRVIVRADLPKVGEALLKAGYIQPNDGKLTQLT